MARKCTHCRTEIPRKKDSDRIQAAGFCSIDCMTNHGIEKGRKRLYGEKRKQHREAKERVKTKSEHAGETQTAFNAYIRERDHDQPCISCGRHHQGQYHAGHYRTVGSSPELRFEPLNCHKQCAPCNNHKSGDIVNYRISLVKRIGQEAVDWLEGPHEPKRYSVDGLKEIKAYYRKLARELKREREGK